MDGQCHKSVMRSMLCVNAQQQQGTKSGPKEGSLTPLQGVRGPALQTSCLVSSVTLNEPTDVLVSMPSSVK